MKAMADVELSSIYTVNFDRDTIEVSLPPDRVLVTFRKIRDSWMRVGLYHDTVYEYLKNYALIDAYARLQYTRTYGQSIRFVDDALPLSTNGWPALEYFKMFQETVTVRLSKQGRQTTVTVNGRKKRYSKGALPKGTKPLVVIVVDSTAQTPIKNILVRVDGAYWSVFDPIGRMTERIVAILNRRTSYAVIVVEKYLPPDIDDPPHNVTVGYFNNMKSDITSAKKSANIVQQILESTSQTQMDPGLFPKSRIVEIDLTATAPLGVYPSYQSYVRLLDVGQNALALHYKNVSYERFKPALMMALNQASLADLGLVERRIEPGLVIHLAWTSSNYRTQSDIDNLATRIISYLAPTLTQIPTSTPDVWYWPACHFVESIVASGSDREPRYSSDCPLQVWVRVNEKMNDDVIVSKDIAKEASYALRGDNPVKWAPCDANIPSNAIIQQNDSTWWRCMPCLEFYHYHMVRSIVHDVLRTDDTGKGPLNYLVCDLNPMSRRVLALYTLSFLLTYLKESDQNIRKSFTKADTAPSPTYKRIVVVGADAEFNLLKNMAEFYRVSVGRNFGGPNSNVASCRDMKDLEFFKEKDAILILNDVKVEHTDCALLVHFTSLFGEDINKDFYHKITFNGAAVHEDMWKKVNITMKIITLAECQDQAQMRKCMNAVITRTIPKDPDSLVCVHSSDTSLRGQKIGEGPSAHRIHDTEELMGEYRPCSDLVTIRPTKKDMRKLYMTLVGPNKHTERGINIHAFFFDDDPVEPGDIVKDLISKASYYRNDTTCYTTGIGLTCGGETCAEVVERANAVTATSKGLPEWYSKIDQIYKGGITADAFFDLSSNPILENGLGHGISMESCDPFATGSVWEYGKDKTSELTDTDKYIMDLISAGDEFEPTASDIWDTMKLKPTQTAIFDDKKSIFKDAYDSFVSKREELLTMTLLQSDQYDFLYNILKGDAGEIQVRTELTEEQSKEMKKKLLFGKSFRYEDKLKGVHTFNYTTVIKPLDFQVAMAAATHFNKKTLVVSSVGSGKSTIYQMCAYYWTKNLKAAVVVVLDDESAVNDQYKKLKNEFGHFDLSRVKKWAKRDDARRANDQLEPGHVYLVSCKVYPASSKNPDGVTYDKFRNLYVIVDEVHLLFNTLVRSKGFKESESDPRRSQYGARKAWMDFITQTTPEPFVKLLCLTATPKVGSGDEYADANEKFEAFFAKIGTTRLYYNGLKDDNMPQLSPHKHLTIDLKGYDKGQCLLGTSKLRNDCVLNGLPNDRGLIFSGTGTVHVPSEVVDSIYEVFKPKQPKTLIAVERPRTAQLLAEALAQRFGDETTIMCLGHQRLRNNSTWYAQNDNAHTFNSFNVQKLNHTDFMNQEAQIIKAFAERSTDVILVMTLARYGKGLDFGGTEYFIRVPLIDSVKEEQLEGRVTRLCKFSKESIQSKRNIPIEHLVLDTRLSVDSGESELVAQMEKMLKTLLDDHVKEARNATNYKWFTDIETTLKEIYGGGDTFVAPNVNPVASAADDVKAGASQLNAALYRNGMQVHYRMAKDVTSQEKTKFTKNFFNGNDIGQVFRCGNVYGPFLDKYTTTMLDKENQEGLLVVWVTYVSDESIGQGDNRVKKDDVVAVMSLRGLELESLIGSTRKLKLNPTNDNLLVSEAERFGIGVNTDWETRPVDAKAVQIFTKDNMDDMVTKLTTPFLTSTSSSKTSKLVHLEFICAKPSFLTGISAGTFLMDTLFKELLDIRTTDTDTSLFILALQAGHKSPYVNEKNIKSLNRYMQIRQASPGHTNQEELKLINSVQQELAKTKEGDKWGEQTIKYFDFYAERVANSFYDSWESFKVNGEDMSLLTHFPDPVPRVEDITTELVKAKVDFTPEEIRIKPIQPPKIPSGFFAKSRCLTMVQATLAKAYADLHSGLSNDTAKSILKERTDFNKTGIVAFDTAFDNADTYTVGMLYRATKTAEGELANIVKTLKKLKTDILAYKVAREAEVALEVKDEPTMQQMFQYLLLKGKLDIIQGAADDLVRKFPVQAVDLVQEGPSAVFKLSKIQSMFTGSEEVIKKTIASL
jgi:hypothetical protein